MSDEERDEFLTRNNIKDPWKNWGEIRYGHGSSIRTRTQNVGSDPDYPWGVAVYSFNGRTPGVWWYEA